MCDAEISVVSNCLKKKEEYALKAMRGHSTL